MTDPAAPTPDADAFRALARSSPWRWRSVHLTYDDGGGRGPVEAWLRRSGPHGPAELVTLGPDGVPSYLADEPRGRSMVGRVEVRAPWEVTPTLRPDGLVAAPRPGDGSPPFVAYGDPPHRGYLWVAALDPVELSSSVEVTDLEEGERRGRTTWWATLRPVPGYDALCSCCALLWSDVAEAVLLTESSGWPASTDVLPTRYRVGLDVRTGVVVDLRPLDGDPRPYRISTTVHGVDDEVDGVVAAALERARG